MKYYHRARDFAREIFNKRQKNLKKALPAAARSAEVV